MAPECHLFEPSDGPHVYVELLGPEPGMPSGVPKPHMLHVSKMPDGKSHSEDPL